MKIVTYNVNGLRPRVSQFGSLLKLLDSLDADIICLQETKISRQDLTADLLVADGYECFFSCTRTTDKGRISYSGVATFCRVKSAFSSNEVALPLAAEEGFTGVLESSKGLRRREDEGPAKAGGLEEFSKEELLKIDSEGRCVITDHGHFVLFNIYGPRAVSDDRERIQFKHTFFMMLQKRWSFLLHQGRRIFIVGDLNIAPAAMDSCNPGPDFDKNHALPCRFRRWFRSLLVENGGDFFDVFRAKHPERTEAFTHWPQNTGAEEFNYGSRIDHILSGGVCLHEDSGQKGHNFVTCHVKECDIMSQFKRWRPGNSPRWKAGRSIKLEGSDHVPVYTSLMEIPDIAQHSTPSLSARFVPEVRGVQQTIVSMMMKRQVEKQVKTDEVSSSFSEENMTVGTCIENLERSSYDFNTSGSPSERSCDASGGSFSETAHAKMSAFETVRANSTPGKEIRKKARHGQSSQQLSLKSFFKKSLTSAFGHDHTSTAINNELGDVAKSDNTPVEPTMDEQESCRPEQSQLNDCISTQDQGDLNACCSSEADKSNVALSEWQRIRQLMQNSMPFCKGHHEHCVSRVVKKEGPNFGRRFYVCARAEVKVFLMRCQPPHLLPFWTPNLPYLLLNAVLVS
ncbi:DNA-(apurinic or apyrimidinic site) endonuclease 2 isoform X2 [Rhododendron vialii]|uniref:DNA-(apurinic or apyrimidinic site) endonuclease 2 isoform X2 n=1 Tax=Rhododendron vialii TaxID=182163 RepID=UPI00265EF3C5|nr:DNA-(apurinic or apyrimidinic site) endonuclease 2 isoform X2 [Rhododendron vialii]